MSIPYFDAHCDTIIPAHFRGAALRKNEFHLDLDRLRAYSPAAQVFAVCVFHKDDMRAVTAQAIEKFHREIAKNSDIVRLCLCGEDIRAAAAEGKIAALLSVEGAEQIGCEDADLRAAFEKGVRIVHLTWNHDNALCGAAMASGSGLTQRGREYVALAQSLGVAIDLSHLSERGFWDVLECAKRPVLAGHSDARALCDHPRNLTDTQIVALIESGGVAGLNFCRAFLGLGEDVKAIVAHAEHYLSLGGEKAVCLGGDLDGIDRLPEGMTGVESLGEIYEAMLRKNWSEDLVRDIFWGNLNAFFGRAL